MSLDLVGRPLLIATHNSGKLAEMRTLLPDLVEQMICAADLGLPEPEETGTTFVENARLKAHAAARASGHVALADDSGLEIDALDGAPGVYTADWAQTPSGRDFGLAMRRAHEALLASAAVEPWRARFRCTLVLAWPEGCDRVYPGAVEGRFIWPPRGMTGHGYDPVFVPDGQSQTFGEMPASTKNVLSHRAAAIRLLLASRNE